MAKFCPMCMSEFTAAVKICPKDHVGLVDKKPKEIERLVDIYIASNEIEAECIVAFLHDEKILAKYSRSGISQIPMVGDASFLISVPVVHAKQAKARIKQAQQDAIISHSGNFL